MAGFTRRYLQDPGTTELLALEGVVIIDGEPPGSVTGVGTGAVCLVGEYEDGPFNEPTEVMSAADLYNTFGGFGYTYEGVVASNPSARKRLADSAIVPEYWNGNGAVALANKRVRRLIIARADTTVGAVQFTRLAFLNGNSYATWDLAPAQVLNLEVDGVADTATFDAARAVKTSAAGVYPAVLVGGETLSITIDTGTTYEVTKVVTFLATDTSQALIVARINAAMGYTCAVDAGAGVTTLTGRVYGTSGRAGVTAGSAAILTATGFTVATASGTGDASDINAVTFAEAKALIEADCAGTLVQRDEDGYIRLASTSTGGSASIQVMSTSTATAFGFPLDTEATPATVGVAGKIPAGTRVRNVGGDEWVVAQSVDVTAATGGPYTARVRPATDDGTAVVAGPGTITVVPYPVVGLGTFAVTNNLAVAAALSESAIDAVYQTALDSTLNPNNVSKEISLIVSARQSNAVRNALRRNALDASSTGLQGRCAVIRPPLGTTRANARAATLQPGVGAYRDERVFYAFPGGCTFISPIATRGLAGGAGFTADGIVDVGSDMWLAAVCSMLPPEENPGQTTSYAAGLIGLERGNTDVQSMTENDYRAFKAAGIAALKFEDGSAVFQSGVTSVLPTLYPNRKNIARRRMADYIQDSLADRLRVYAKKLATNERRQLVVGEVQGFLDILKSAQQPSSQRIDSYLLDDRSGNTPELIAAGLFRLIIKVRTLPSMDVLVLDTQIGENVVTVQEAA